MIKCKERKTSLAAMPAFCILNLETCSTTAVEIGRRNLGGIHGKSRFGRGFYNRNWLCPE